MRGVGAKDAGIHVGCRDHQKMTRKSCFRTIVLEIRQIDLLREETLLRAFVTLEARQATLANLLLESVGTRQSAARWMSAQRRAFDGKSAYEVLAEGDLDRVWDRVEVEAGQAKHTDV